MLVKRRGGMTEFIPSPSEKRDGVIRNHVLDLLSNLDARLRRIEAVANLPSDLADSFADTMTLIIREEAHVHRLNEALLGSESVNLNVTDDADY
ncbi:VrlD [bacterium]|nr:VrlD [bacterium]